MIEKNDILHIAEGLGLRPDTVEKDYVLGWLLKGIHKHPLTANWIFKGGTSLKKCYFETFRFSEDLDFTITDPSQINELFLMKAFREIADTLYDEAGIIFSNDMMKFKVVKRENGKLFAQGKMYYNGPLQRRQKVASIKLDLTTDEILVLHPVTRQVHHPYQDEPTEGIYALCYAFEEVVAEKIRALAERARPRDLYDVVHFFRNRHMLENPTLIFNVLQKKCSYKKIDVPTYKHIEEHEKIEELESEWKHMLAHQLSHLPALEAFWIDLQPFFKWLEGELHEERLVSISDNDEKIFSPDRETYGRPVNYLVQKIQFAAANRICMRLQYDDKIYTIEPYSMRTSNQGNVLLYGYERENGQIKAFSLSKIQSMEIANIGFQEKYRIEISTRGIVTAPPIRRGNK